jgi:putative glycosyltransferase
MFNNETHAEEFIKKCIEVLNKINIISYEIIIVDDDSTDNTYEILKSVSKKQNKIKLIKLNKNYGQSYALITGFQKAEGDFIFTLDSDLEEDPKELSRFYNHLISNNLDDVYGYTKRRKGGLLQNLTGNLFYFLTNLFNNSKKKINFYVTSMRLFTKKINKNFNSINDKDIFFTSVFQELKIKSDGLLIKKLNTSKSTYTFIKRVKLSLNYFLIHGNEKILNCLIIFLTFMFLFIFLASLYSLINFFIFDIPSGYTSIILSIWFFGITILLSNILIVNLIYRLYKLQNIKKDSSISELVNFD